MFQKMIVNPKNFYLYKLVLNSLLLDNCEYSYLCPLLKQTGLYSGHVDTILTASKLSQQAQYIKRFLKKIADSLNNTHKYIKKSYSIHRLVQNNIVNRESDDTSHEKLFFEYYQQRLISEKYLFNPFLFFEKSFFDLLRPKINKIQLELFKQNTFDESVFTCITVFLVYKIWKIEYLYPLISKLAFDSKEIGIAKYYIQLAKLEYNILFLLVNLFK
jgi:hypothetical protein